MKRNKSYSIILWIVSYLVGCVILFLSFKTDRFDSIIGLLSAYTAVYSLVLMLVQFKSIRKVSEETKTKLNQTIAVSDLSRYSELIRGLGTDVRSDNYEVALYKTQNIKDMAHKIEISDASSSQDVEYVKIYSILDTHINSYNDRLLSEETELNKRVILDELETVTTFFQRKANEMIDIMN